jgi:ATP-binding cassette subfamily B protein
LIRLEGGLYRRLFERQALELTKGFLDDGAKTAHLEPVSD